MRAIRIYGTGAATANNVASVVIPSAARLLGIQVGVMLDSITDNANAVMELSLASATEIAVNGSQQAVLEVRAYSNFVTSGLSHSSVNQYFPVDLSLRQGQYVYLHVTVGGTITYWFNGILWLTN